MCSFHQFSCVWTHCLTNFNVFFTDFINIITIRPDFVRGTGYALCTTGCSKLWLIWHTITVKSHNRTECSIFKPAYKYFMIIFIIDVCSKESTNIGCPPRNTGKSHVKTCCKLILKTFKCRMNISGPYECTIFLTSCPCTAKQVDYIFLSLCSHAIKECFCIHCRINITNLYVWS